MLFSLSLSLPTRLPFRMFFGEREGGVMVCRCVLNKKETFLLTRMLLTTLLPVFLSFLLFLYSLSPPRLSSSTELSTVLQLQQPNVQQDALSERTMHRQHDVPGL